MKLFSTGKTGVTLDHIVHKLEKRKGDEVKVIELKCRVQPFTSQLALAIDEIVKTALFKRTTGDPHAHVKEFVFLLPVERQQVYIFASPDTEKPSILFDQVKVSNLRARTEKGAGGYVLTFSLTFSQDDKQLSFAESWRTEMRFLSFEESEPSLEFSDDEPDEDEADDNTTSRPAPMFDDPRDAPQPQSVGAAAAKPAKERTQRKNISHASGKKKR